MKRVFLNISNHPSSGWSDAQRRAALNGSIDEIVDLPFPNVSAWATRQDVTLMVNEILGAIDALEQQNLIEPRRVCRAMVQGEMTLTFELIPKLVKNSIHCVAACSERHVKTIDGKKIVSFGFTQFRAYNL